MIKRELNLSKLLKKNYSALIFGARGTGKSHLAAQYIKSLGTSSEVMQLNLLESDTFEKYLKQPHLLRKEIVKKFDRGVSSAPLCVFIDEIQKVPKLLDEVHSLIESYPEHAQFLMTGSSARKLKRSSANLLAGRALSLRLHPFTYQEWENDIFDRLQFGSLPGIAFKFRDDDDTVKLALKSYVSTYLKEEIQQEALVRRLDSFARFLEIAGQYHAKTINTTDIAKSSGVSAHTIAEYIQILEDTLVAIKIPGWSASTKKQLRTTPKLYLFDNGVANALRGELSVPVRESTTRFGDLYEGMVVQEMIRANDYLNLDLKFSYWRTNNDMEVDIIVSRGAGQPLAAIEIKSSKTPERKEFHGLEAFKTDYPSVPQYCICRADRAYTTDQGIEVKPHHELVDLLNEISK